MFKDSEEKEESGEVAIGFDAFEIHIHATNQEGINDLLADGHEIYDDIIPNPENKLNPKGDTDQPVYK